MLTINAPAGYRNDYVFNTVQSLVNSVGDAANANLIKAYDIWKRMEDTPGGAAAQARYFGESDKRMAEFHRGLGGRQIFDNEGKLIPDGLSLAEQAWQATNKGRNKVASVNKDEKTEIAKYVEKKGPSMFAGWFVGGRGGGFRPEDFARSHPGGALGRKLLVHVADLMVQGDALPIVATDTPFIEMMRTMSAKGLAVDAARTFLKPPSANIGFTYKLEISEILANANVVMNLGDTLVLGGLSEKESTTNRDGVPLLQDLPGVQYLFSQQQRTDYQRSVLILITPRPAAYTWLAEDEQAAAASGAAGAGDQRPLAQFPEAGHSAQIGRAHV